MNGADYDRIRDALRFIDSTDRDTWLRVGMAIKSELGDGGFDLWDAWSQTAHNYNARDARDVWRSIKANGGVTIGTLFRLARENGWSQSDAPRPIPIAERRHISAEHAAKGEVETERANTAALAASIWAKATEAKGDHFYLARKQIHPVEALREIGVDQATRILGYHPRAKDEALQGRLLVVPIKQGEQLSTVELIDEMGRKAALRGRGTKVGGYWASERLPEGDGAGLTLLVGEGMATALSAAQATGKIGVAALANTNLKAVAEGLRKRYLRAEIVVLADLEKSSGKPDPHAVEAARACGGKVAVPDFGEGREPHQKDFNDMLTAYGEEAVRRCIAEAREPSTHPAILPKQRRAIDLLDFMQHEFPAREYVLAPVFQLGSLNMVYSWRGIGKTHFCLGVAYAAASGSEFLGWRAERPFRTLYIDGEMPGEALQSRLARIVQASEKEPPNGFLRILTIDLEDGRMPDLGTVEGQLEITDECERAELIILDNLSCLVRSGRENEAEGWTAVATFALQLRARGKCVVFVHHAGKSGEQRGTSKREDVLDTVISLKRPTDYEPEQGARFVVSFTKARHLTGKEAQPFEAWLQADERGQQCWTMKPHAEATFERIVELANLGMSQKEIAEELGVNKSTVCRHWNRAATEGLIQAGRQTRKGTQRHRREIDG